MCCTAHLLSLTRCPVIKKIARYVHWNSWEDDSSQKRLGLESLLDSCSVHTSSAWSVLKGQEGQFQAPQWGFTHHTVLIYFIYIHIYIYIPVASYSMFGS